MERTEWLDGLRGIAAFVVVIDHYLLVHFDAPFRSYWSEPPEKNRYLFQLPLLNLPFAAHAMVALFMVISGYAISIRPLKILQNEGAGARLFHSLSSAARRRIFRIYLPALAVSTMSQLLFFLGLYKYEYPDSILKGIRPWTSPWSHVHFLFCYFIDLLGSVRMHDNAGLNGQLWTMPIEFRGSCAIYLIILVLSTWQARLRAWVPVALMGIFFRFGSWDLLGFAGGLFLAYMRIFWVKTESLPQTTVESIRKGSQGRLFLQDFGTAATFVAGVYLLCLDNSGVLPLGYQWLAIFQPAVPAWTHPWVVKDNWRTVGSLLVVFAIDRSPAMQALMTTRLVQLLGEISFPIYLVHYMVFNTLAQRLRNIIWWAMHRQPYPPAIEAWERPTDYLVTIFGCGMVLLPVTVYTAVLYYRFVDKKCVALTKNVGELLAAGKHIP